jgi:hypothetical protein
MGNESEDDRLLMAGLAQALAASQWRLAELLTLELKARREMRGGVVQLDAERNKRREPR